MLRMSFTENETVEADRDEGCKRIEQTGLVCEQACLRQMGGARRWMLLQMATYAQKPSAFLL